MTALPNDEDQSDLAEDAEDTNDAKDAALATSDRQGGDRPKGWGLGKFLKSAGSAVKKTSQDIAQATGSAIVSTAQATVQTTGNIAQATGSAIVSTAQATVQTTGNIAQATGSAIVSTAQATVQTTGNIAQATGSAIVSTAQATVHTTGNISQATGSAIVSTAQATVQTTGNIAQATGSAVIQAAHQSSTIAGQWMNTIADNPQLKMLTQSLNIDWLLEIIDRIDVVNAAQSVQQLKDKYPSETPAQISYRLIRQKVLYVGGSGLVSSLVPGFAAGAIALDQFATTSIQAEMGYQIAAAYGMDLQEPARKGEILAIFGAALGTNSLAKLGLQYLLRNVPVAGAVVGASSNAVALYAVGYAAGRFYEAKGAALQSKAIAAAEQQAGEDFLARATAQQILMDQILSHLVRVSYPEKKWEEILPELIDSQISPASLEVIQDTIENPIPLDRLLLEIDADFGLALLAQCQFIAKQDGIITPEEASILEQITQMIELPTESENS